MKRRPIGRLFSFLYIKWKNKNYWGVPASLCHYKHKDKLCLESIYLPYKISVIDSDTYQTILNIFAEI